MEGTRRRLHPLACQAAPPQRAGVDQRLQLLQRGAGSGSLRLRVVKDDAGVLRALVVALPSSAAAKGWIGLRAGGEGKGSWVRQL